ncbi:hypothetical protein KCU98_g67, partial [Aureobasidium melanogenum]
MRAIVSGLVLKNECIALFLALTQPSRQALIMRRRHESQNLAKEQVALRPVSNSRRCSIAAGYDAGEFCALAHRESFPSHHLSSLYHRSTTAQHSSVRSIMANMVSSFTALPPEIRSVVYNILLHDTLSNNKRLIYDGACPECCTTSCQEPKKHGKVLPFASRKFNAHTFPHKTLYVHLADFGDLLRLAATCKLLRSEILGLVWSNADIFIKSNNLAKTLTHIFDDCLSTECCNFIRTLHVDIPRPVQEEPDHTKQIVKLIHHRLPRLEELILSLFKDRNSYSLHFPQAAMSVLASLPSRINVQFRNYSQYNLSPHQQYRINPQVGREYLNTRDEAYLDAIRSRRERRKQKKAEKKRRNEAVDGLGDAVETHSSIISNQLSSTNTREELGVEDALEVTERLRSLMIG